MERTKIEMLRNFMETKKKFIAGYRLRTIKDKNDRIFANIKEYSEIDLPENVMTFRDILNILDTNNGICERKECANLKKCDGNRWKLRKFCSRRCADMEFSFSQKGSGNSIHNITEEGRRIMGEKLSKRILINISEGKFTPNITNSWANSKFKVIIEGKEKFVRSSWEAYFFILNPHLLYELVRIPYFDSRKMIFRNYITDFCDPVNRIIYEIKPKSKVSESSDKINSAKKWCKNNFYEYLIIDQEWIIKNYDREVLNDQPEGDRIAMLIEKMIRYEN